MFIPGWQRGRFSSTGPVDLLLLHGTLGRGNLLWVIRLTVMGPGGGGWQDVL